MKFLLTASLVALLSVPAFAFNVSKVVQSVLPITFNGANICTATHINSKRSLWLTADHCVPPPEMDLQVQIGGQPAIVVDRDAIKDMAILQVEGLRAKPLKMQTTHPKVGQKIYMYGHPIGYEAPQLFQGYISSLNLSIDWDGTTYRYMMFDMTVCGGNSGSAVLNNDHEVVSVVQINHGRPCDGFSGGSRWVDMVGFAYKYFQR